MYDVKRKNDSCLKVQSIHEMVQNRQIKQMNIFDVSNDLGDSSKAQIQSTNQSKGRLDEMIDLMEVLNKAEEMSRESKDEVQTKRNEQMSKLGSEFLTVSKKSIEENPKKTKKMQKIVV